MSGGDDYYQLCTCNRLEALENGKCRICGSYWRIPRAARRADQMSIREHFAAMAMQGIATRSAFNTDHASCARVAVQIADALIAELAKPVKS